MQDAVLIAGLESRHGAEVFERAKTLLTERGVRIVEAHPVDHKKAVCKRVRQAIKSGHKLICVAGGDGAQTSVVGYFAHTDAVLGVLPSGTGNSFAMSLGIDDFDMAIDAIVQGKVAQVDLGLADDVYFANFATVGLTAEIGDDTPKGLKRVLGPLAYGVASIAPIVTHKPFRSRVSWKNNKLDLETHQMIVANGRYYGHEPISEDATITDGELAFFATTGTGRMDLMRMYVALARGEQMHLPDAHTFSAKKITIKTKPRQDVSVDGNFLCRTPITFSVARKALNVMVPQNFPEGLR
ncbi:MAG TPA: YegS/Rv2252/BmrU family lipid kinase [Candidatus Baltobacteraceae bacterium]|jgi:YegS/Rv2252/BmrU family lipid kinase